MKITATGLLLACWVLQSQAAHAAAVESVVESSNNGFRFLPASASLPKGTQISKLVGDPAQTGPFVLRLIFPAHTDIMPHTHSKPETVTVLSGTIFHEHGPKLVRSQGTQLAAGGFVYLPEGMPHSLWTTDQQAVLQVSGTGPFGLQYVNPADDPSRAK